MQPVKGKYYKGFAIFRKRMSDCVSVMETRLLLWIHTLQNVQRNEQRHQDIIRLQIISDHALL